MTIKLSQFTDSEQLMLIESVYTRIRKIEALIPSLLLPELKSRYENDLEQLRELYNKLNESYFNNL